MSFTFENQGTNTYLVYEIGAEDVLDTMSLGMLTNNAIPGLAAASFMQMDATQYIKYNVSAKVSVSQLFSGAVNKKRLIGVFSGIVDAMLSAEEYMLDPNNLVLDLDYIFADVSTCETVAVCLPVMNCEKQNPELGVFFKNIIFNTQFDQTENCDHVAKILNYLNSVPVLSLADFKNLLDTIKRGDEPTRAPQPRVTTAAAQAASAAPATTPPATKAAQKPHTSKRAAPAQGGNGASPVGNRNYGNVPVAGQNFVNPVVPPMAGVAPSPVPNFQQAAPEQEKPMSMLYLLQHYNKENAAIYKAQQEAKKTQKGKTAAAQPTAQQMPFQMPSNQPNAGYAIPGKQAPGNFAVPQQGIPPVQRPAQPIPQAPATPAVRQQTPQPTYPQATSVNRQPVQPSQQPMQTPQRPVQVPQQPMQVPQRPVQPSQRPVQIPQRTVQTPQQANRPVQPAMPVQPQVQEPQRKPINFGETTVLSGGIGETTVLTGATEPNKVEPHLIRMKNQEKILLNKPVFRIGKERSYVDYFIGDNTAISRSHANIVNNNGTFFVVDTNSTNHTYVNGKMISSNVATRLAHGTKIRLANEDFEFKMY